MKNIVLRVFQNVRELADDYVTRLDKNKGSAFEMRDLTKLQWAGKFRRSKGDFQRSKNRSSLLRLRLVSIISELTHCVWGLWTTVLYLIGTWMLRMDSMIEESNSAKSPLIMSSDGDGTKIWNDSK